MILFSRSRIQRCENWYRAFTNTFTSSSINFGFALKLLRIKDQWDTVLVKCQFVCNRDLLVLTSMLFDRTSSEGKCYGAGRRWLSPGSFQKGLENWERTVKWWNQQHSRSFAKKPIHEAWERLKRSRSCERFFVDILLEQADLYLLVFFLDIQTFYQVLFAQVYSVRLTPI